LLALALALIPSVAPAQGTGGPVANDSRTGYIDNAVPGDIFRLRMDASYNNRRPSRAEFFWPKNGQPFTPGPPFRERRVDYQDFTAALELLAAERLSVFVELPFRLLNPAINDNTAGLADLNAGFKYAFVATDDLVATFQLRTFAPSGDADRGLGTNHVTLEPALLAYAPLTERWRLEGEFRVWVPVDGTDFAGEVLRYGIGTSYTIYEGCRWWIAPVAEFVGWTALDGKKAFLAPSGIGFVRDAAGDTIVNAKLGVRLGLRGLGDIYAGYGRPLTGERWYENTFRLELRLVF
jgi:hypothetical protein